MTLNEFLKDHPEYADLQIVIDENDVVRIFPNGNPELEAAPKGVAETTRFAAPIGF